MRPGTHLQSGHVPGGRAGLPLQLLPSRGERLHRARRALPLRGTLQLGQAAAPLLLQRRQLSSDGVARYATRRRHQRRPSRQWCAAKRHGVMQLHKDGKVQGMQRAQLYA
jgi:hypothetical protein